MTIKQVVAPDVEVPVLEGVVKTDGGLNVLIELPGVDGTNHRRDGATFFQRKGVSQVLVVGIAVSGTIIDYPPGVGTPEQPTVAGDGSVQVECRREVGELEAVVEIE